MFRKWIACVLAFIAISGGVIYAVVEKRPKEPQLTLEQRERIRTLQVTLMRLTPAYEAAKNALDAEVAKDSPPDYVITDGPEGLKLVKDPKAQPQPQPQRKK